MLFSTVLPPPPQFHLSPTHKFPDACLSLQTYVLKAVCMRSSMNKGEENIKQAHIYCLSAENHGPLSEQCPETAYPY